jgi:hypothetical protein
MAAAPIRPTAWVAWAAPAENSDVVAVGVPEAEPEWEPEWAAEWEAE